MPSRHPTRRAILAAAPLILTLRPAQGSGMPAAIREFLGADAPAPRPGRVQIDLPPLVENGNAVPLTVTVDSPMTAEDRVRRIAVFTERNPLPGVIVAELGPRAGAARLETRIRLATSQRLVAVAEMHDGSAWSAEAEVVVTLAACVEG